MPTTLVRENNETCPILICDTCGEEIKKASKGYVIWNVTKDWKTVTEMRFIHQGVCDPRIEGKRQFQMSMSLNDYLGYLLNNLSYEPKKDFELRRAM